MSEYSYMYGKEAFEYNKAAFDYDREKEDWDSFLVRKESERNSKSNKIVSDAVNHPAHYNKGIETSEYIKSWEMNWNQGNVIKYVTRYNLKNTDVNLQIQDLQKARWYLEDLIKELEKKNPY